MRPSDVNQLMGIQQACCGVQGSQAYWARHGFQAHALRDGPEQERLRSCGEGAAYMLAAL